MLRDASSSISSALCSIMCFLGNGDSYEQPPPPHAATRSPPPLVWKSNGGNMRLPQGSSLLVGSGVQWKPCKFPLEIGNNSRTHSVSFETCVFLCFETVLHIGFHYKMFCLYQGRRSSTFQSLVQMCWLYAVVIMQWNHGMQSVNAQCTLSNFISIVCFMFVLSKMVMLSKV